MGNDELAEYLEALQREECYRVDAVVKESPYELTQRVSFVGANGAERGPYIRKFIKREAGMGAIYERLYTAQRAGKRFKHLPQILECYVHDDYLAVVMEYVHGETLQELVYREDPSTDLAVNVFPMLCDAASELHEEFDPPVIHRDLKPSNIILSGANLTVIDFGIAREFKDGADADTAHFGTRSFAPPEQFGFGQTTVRSDVYALGMLLYYCLTERIPDASNRSDWYLDRRIPVALRGVIAKATALDPQQRFESARQLREAFLRATFQDEGSAASAVAESVQAHDARPDEPAPSIAPSIGTPAPQVPAQEQRKVRPPTSVRNVITGFCVVILTMNSLWHIPHPPESSAGYPTWYIALTYGFVLPALLCIIGFAIWDKTYLKQRFPILENLRARDYIAAVVVVFVLFAICLGVIPAIIRATT